MSMPALAVYVVHVTSFKKVSPFSPKRISLLIIIILNNLRIS